jgi:nucleoside-diphosphate-sugar epimerase
MGLLSGKHAVVTGGASGIGRAIAIAFAKEGSTVTIADYASEAAIADAAKAAGNGDQGRRVNVADEKDVTQLFEAVAQSGGVDILVNCAGILIEKPLLETSVADFDRQIGVNLKGVFLVGREALRLMMAQGRGGRVINIASELAYLGRENCSLYCASKGGVLGTRIRAEDPGQYDRPRPDRHADARHRADLGGDAGQGIGQSARPPRPAGRDRLSRPLPRRTRLHLHDRPMRQPQWRRGDVLER